MVNSDSGLSELTPYHARQAELLRQPTKDNREAASILQIETLSTYAQIGRTIYEAFRKNPKSSVEELLASINHLADQVPHTYVVNKLALIMRQAEEKRRELVDNFIEQSGLTREYEGFLLHGERQKLGNWVYERLAGCAPQGEVLVSETPLAITLVIANKDDFAKIDPRENVGGFYRKDASLTDDPDNKFPLIVARNLNKVIQHELNHAIIACLRQATPSILFRGHGWHEKQLTQEIPEISTSPDQDTRLIIEKLGNPQSDLMKWAFSKAKDELISQAIVDGNYNYVDHLVDEEGLYNYIFMYVSKNLKKHADMRVIYNRLWALYTADLNKSVELIKKLHEAYSFSPERQKNIPWLLAQLPATDWQVSIQALIDDVSHIDLVKNSIQQTQASISFTLDRINYGDSTHPPIIKLKGNSHRLAKNSITSLYQARRALRDLVNTINSRCSNSVCTSYQRLSIPWKTQLNEVIEIVTNIHTQQRIEHTPGYELVKLSHK